MRIWRKVGMELNYITIKNGGGVKKQKLQCVNQQTCRDIMEFDDRKWWIIQEQMGISQCNSCKRGYWISGLLHVVVTHLSTGMHLEVGS